jgi:hypothetical protein
LIAVASPRTVNAGLISELAAGATRLNLVARSFADPAFSAAPTMSPLRLIAKAMLLFPPSVPRSVIVPFT